MTTRTCTVPNLEKKKPKDILHNYAKCHGLQVVCIECKVDGTNIHIGSERPMWLNLLDYKDFISATGIQEMIYYSFTVKEPYFTICDATFCF